MEYFVGLGDISHGFEFIGPFHYADEASNFIYYHTEDGEGSIFELKSPGEFRNKNNGPV